MFKGTQRVEYILLPACELEELNRAQVQRHPVKRAYCKYVFKDLEDDVSGCVCADD